MSDLIHQPRDDNGRFAAVVTLAQFEEYRKAVEQRFAAQEKGIERAALAVRELTETHQAAHKAEHDANQLALNKEAIRNDDRLRAVEGRLADRVTALENAELVSATKDDVKGARTLAIVAAIGSGLVGIITAVRVFA